MFVGSWSRGRAVAFRGGGGRGAADATRFAELLHKLVGCIADLSRHVLR